MSLIATIATYNFYEKQKIWKSFKAGLWIAAGTIAVNFIPGLPAGFFVSAAIYFGLVWLLASGKIDYLAAYRTKNPMKTAIVSTIVALIWWLFIMTTIFAIIGWSVLLDIGTQSIV